jgi:hypothetical protein
MYGFGFRGDELSGDCDECTASMMRFGVQGQYHLTLSENIDPWFGLGIGYESVQAHSRTLQAGLAFGVHRDQSNELPLGHQLGSRCASQALVERANGQRVALVFKTAFRYARSARWN